MRTVDGHCHLTFLPADTRGQVIENGLSRGIGLWLLGGYDPIDWQCQLDLKKQFPENIQTSLGLHPWIVQKTAEHELEDYFSQLQTLLESADMLGELGLDFHVAKSERERSKQKKWFVRQLELLPAKPLVLHIVQAHAEAITILSKIQQKSPGGLKGLVHRYTGSLEIAHHYLDLGLILSIGPDVLRPNAKRLREVVEQLPDNALVVESDSPGSRNSQESPIEKFFQVAGKVAEIRGVEVSQILQSSASNCRKLLA